MDEADGPGEDANQEIGDPGESANREIGDPGKGANQEIGGPRGWHSRGYLPHYDDDEKIQHVTFHLADSLPRDVVQRMDEELKALPPEKQDVERRKRVEAWLDAGHGSCVLRQPGIARMVEGSLRFFDAQRYYLLAWAVMPNHVHALFQPVKGRSVAKIVASWKKFTATHICAFRRSSAPGNANLPISDETNAVQQNGAPGNANLPIGDNLQPVWHREYWDRFIRDEGHFQQAIQYIHQNPVNARLVAKAEDWPWSSARFSKSANPEIGGPGENANPEIGGPGEDANPEIGGPGSGSGGES